MAEWLLIIILLVCFLPLLLFIVSLFIGREEDSKKQAIRNSYREARKKNGGRWGTNF